MGTLMGLVDTLHNKTVQGLQSFNGNSNMNNLQMEQTFRAPKSAAMFDLTITRNTADIPNDLPIPFFGALDYQSNYVEVISSYLPAGVSLYNDGDAPITLSPSGKGLRFHFFKVVGGVNTFDTIDVECSQVPYVNLLRATQGSLINMQQNKMTISNVAIQSQFSNSVYIYRNSLFGKDSTDSFTPNQFKSDLQNQNDIRTITTNYTVDQETSMVFLIKPVESFQIGWTSYVEQYDTIRG